MPRERYYDYYPHLQMKKPRHREIKQGLTLETLNLAHPSHFKLQGPFTVWNASKKLEKYTKITTLFYTCVHPRSMYVVVFRRTQAGWTQHLFGPSWYITGTIPKPMQLHLLHLQPCFPKPFHVNLSQKVSPNLYSLFSASGVFTSFSFSIMLPLI